MDEYYFMPDPHQLIFTHYPDDNSWQLLYPAITLIDFENLIPVKSAFFKYGLKYMEITDLRYLISSIFYQACRFFLIETL